MYFANEMSGLSGIGSKLKKAVKAPIKVAQKVVQKTPMPKPMRKIAQKPLSFATRQIDKGTPLDPGTRMLQHKYGRTKEQRKENVQGFMRKIDKVTGQTKQSQRLMRVLDPSSKILDEVANAQLRLQRAGLAPKDNTFFGKARRWVSPASYLHRSGGPIRKGPAAVPVTTPSQTTEVLEVPPVQDDLAPSYETYPADPRDAQAYSFPQLPDNMFVEPLPGTGDASPEASQNGAPEVAPKKPMDRAALLRLGLAAFALFNIL